jgi:hypothetical protein
MIYQHITVPQAGAKIEVKPDFSLSVPDQPIVAFIEGDGKRRPVRSDAWDGARSRREEHGKSELPDPFGGDDAAASRLELGRRSGGQGHGRCYLRAHCYL